MTEVIIYQVYNAGLDHNPNENGGLKESIKINFLDGMALEEVSSFVAEESQAVARPSRFSLKLAKILAVVGVSILAIYFTPGAASLAKSVWSWGASNYKLSGNEVQELTNEGQGVTVRPLPAFDPALPKTNRIFIPSIGVDTDIEEATYDNYEAALKKGVWRVSNFGEPDETGAPIILAAHRYGYLAWTNTFRRKNSFYNLPKVEVGDIITIDWQQREYKYGVYKTENGEEITDYSADLILYTCINLSGPERIFVYARLIS